MRFLKETVYFLHLTLDLNVCWGKVYTDIISDRAENSKKKKKIELIPIGLIKKGQNLKH
jgi:hypothetical protein